jgi:uncharacterized protein YjbJ (UPF0337 family)
MSDKIHRTPSEVAADASIEHTGKGVINQVKGTVKEAWGHVTGDSGTKFEGKVDQLKGRAQEKLGELERKEARLESEIERKS